MGRWLWLVLLLVSMALWGCLQPVTPTPEATPTAAVDCAPVWTRAVAAEVTLSAVETVVDQLAAGCGELWDTCCVPATLQSTQCAVATLAASLPTVTPQPAATAAVLCQRCLAGSAEYGCESGYSCVQCDSCHWLCVRDGSPRSDCNYCANLGLP
jgi:hypothetical protein